MDKALFVKNIKHYCKVRGVKPTNACRESGAGASFISNIESRGQTPSVEKVEMLAHYLGVTVSELIGETSNPQKLADLPETLTLRDSAVMVHPTDVKRLTVGEVEMIMAYRRATVKERRTIDGILGDYKKGTVSGLD